jgi:flagellar protein FlaF
MLPDLYSETVTRDSGISRQDECEAFDIIIAGLRDATTNTERKNALEKAEMLWMYLLEDLSKDENKLSIEVRAKLISVGLWALKEVTSLSLDKKRKTGAFIEVCQIIRDGLE